MAKRGKSERIEPSFEGSKARGELSVSESDRVLPAARGKGKAKGSRGGKTAGSGRSGGRSGSGGGTRSVGGRGKARRRRGGGVFGFVRGMAYWMLVLGIWAGIAGAGLTAYYGARMRIATTW